MFGLHLDAISFAIGFVTALLGWWAVGQVRIHWPRLQKRLKAAIEARRRRETSEVEERLRRETLRRVENMHLAAALFSLDEIIVPPTLLAPPPRIVPDSPDNPNAEDLLVIPYLPDWPEMTSQLTVPRITLAEALQNGVNIAVIGQPGSGKTITLAHLAAQVARREVDALIDWVPLFIPAGELPLGPEIMQDPLGILIEYARGLVPVIIAPQVPAFIKGAATGGLLLIIDGGDEFSQPQMVTLGTFIKSLLNQNPNLHLAMAAAPEFLDGLPQAGIVPLAVAAWNTAERTHFVAQWGTRWTENITPLQEKSGYAGIVDPALLNNWVAAGISLLTPLELTLKIWAIYAGDAYGPRNTDALDLYLRRTLPDIKLLAPLTQLALQMVKEGQAVLLQSKFTASAALGNDALFANGLLVHRQRDSLAFGHPVLLGYLASQVAAEASGATETSGVAESDGLAEIATQPAWAGRDLLLHYVASHQDMTAIVEPWLKQDEDDPLRRNLFTMAHWLRDVPTNAGWRTGVMRQLLGAFQRESAPFSLRSRALAALVCSNDPSVVLLLRDQLAHQSPTVRHLAVLGSGALQDTRAYRDLISLLADPDRAVRQAVCYTLLAFNIRQTIDIVNDILKQGNEELSRLVAEGLAMRPDIGHKLLQEGSITENLMARRAVIFGLTLVPDPWTAEILQKMCIEDGQWVVRNAASQAIENRKKPSPYLPWPLTPPHELPWLVTFASHQGRGISPQQPVADLLLQALKSGTAEEQIACLDYLRSIKPDEGIMGTLFNKLYGNDSRLGDDIFYTLWLYSSSGWALPAARQFGIG